MKNIKRMMLGAVICVTVLLTGVSAFAEETTDITISLDPMKSTEGIVSVSEGADYVSEFEAVSVTPAGSANADRAYIFTANDEAVKGTVSVAVTLKDGYTWATTTDKSNNDIAVCVSYSGGYTDANDEYYTSGMTGSACKYIYVEDSSSPVDPTPTPTPTPSTPSKPATGVKVNYSGLFAQINAAEGLNVESAPLNAALISAKNLMAEKNQTIVDLVAAMLEAIIAGVN